MTLVFLSGTKIDTMVVVNHPVGMRAAMFRKAKSPGWTDFCEPLGNFVSDDQNILKAKNEEKTFHPLQLLLHLHNDFYKVVPFNNLIFCISEYRKSIIPRPPLQ